MKHINTLQEMSKETEAVFAEKQNAVNTILNGIVTKIKNNIIINIPSTFTKELQACIGNCNSIRKEAINNEFRKSEQGQVFEKNAKKVNKDYETYVRSVDGTDSYYSYTRSYPVYLGLTKGIFSCGSYVNDRYSGVQFGNLFKYLKPDFANCLKDDDKRQCILDFCEYRDNFIREHNKIKFHKVVDIPVQCAKLNCLSLSEYQFIATGDGGKKKTTFHSSLIEKTEPVTITDVCFNTPEYEVWNGIERPYSQRYYDSQNTDANFSLNIEFGVRIKNNVFFAGNAFINDTYCGTMYDDIINSKYDKDAFGSLAYSKGTESRMLHIISNNNYSRYSRPVNLSGVILDIDKILNNDEVKSEYNSIINFYLDQTKLFLALREKHQTLSFVNKL